MYRRAVAIYNPRAGRRLGRRALPLDAILRELRRDIASVEAAPTVGPGSATSLAARACDSGADLILACGGDGTINEVLNGVVGREVHLGVLPAGTANVLAVEAGIPTNATEAARQIARYRPCCLSVGAVLCQGKRRYFLLMGGVGLDAQVVYDLNLRLKSFVGELAYWAAAFARFGRSPDLFDVQVDGQRYKCSFVLASKSGEYGGRLQIAAGANLLASDFEVALFHTRSNWRYLALLAQAARGALRTGPHVTLLRARRVDTSARNGSPVHVEVDGEYIGTLPATLEIATEPVTLLLPPEYVKAHG